MRRSAYFVVQVQKSTGPSLTVPPPLRCLTRRRGRVAAVFRQVPPRGLPSQVAQGRPQPRLLPPRSLRRLLQPKETQAQRYTASPPALPLLTFAISDNKASGASKKKKVNIDDLNEGDDDDDKGSDVDSQAGSQDDEQAEDYDEDSDDNDYAENYFDNGEGDGDDDGGGGGGGDEGGQSLSLLCSSRLIHFQTRRTTRDCVLYQEKERVYQYKALLVPGRTSLSGLVAGEGIRSDGAQQTSTSPPLLLPLLRRPRQPQASARRLVSQGECPAPPSRDSILRVERGSPSARAVEHGSRPRSSAAPSPGSSTAPQRTRSSTAP